MSKLPDHPRPFQPFPHHHPFDQPHFPPVPSPVLPPLSQRSLSWPSTDHRAQIAEDRLLSTDRQAPASRGPSRRPHARHRPALSNPLLAAPSKPAAFVVGPTGVSSVGSACSTSPLPGRQPSTGSLDLSFLAVPSGRLPPSLSLPSDKI
jgi:hypothetical protein